MDDYTKEKLQDFKDRINRMESHMESERDRIVEVSKRLDAAVRSMDRIEKQIDLFDNIIRNGGKGLQGRVSGLEKDAENNDKAWHRWGAILGGSAGIAALVIEIIRK